MNSVNDAKTENHSRLLESLLSTKIINESSLSMITYISLTNHFLKIPHVLCNLLSYSEEELLALKLSDIIYPEDFETYIEKSTGLLNGEINSFDIECRVNTKNKETIWLHFNCSIVNDDAAKSICIIAYITNITPRKNNEEGLLETNRNLEKIVNEQNAKLSSRHLELVDFVENAPLGLHWVGPDGIIQWANKTEMDLLGYDREEYIGRHISEFHADANTIQDILDRLGNNETLKGYEATLLAKDGSIKTVLISSNVYREDGKFIHTRCFTRDITDKKIIERRLKEHEEALIESERQRRIELQRMLNKMPAGAYTCDAEGLITFYNEKASELWGRKPKLNDPVDRFCGSFKLYINDELIKHDECWMAQALKEGRSFNSQEITVERPNGEKLTVMANANPIQDETGKIIGAVNVLVDISERKRLEESLRKSENMYQSLFESTLDGILIVDDAGIYVNVNESYASMLKYERKDLIGQHFRKFIPPDRLDSAIKQFANLKETGVRERNEFPLMASDGTLVDFEWISRSNFQQGLHFCVARDITERKQSEKKLREEYSFRKAIENSVAAGIAAVNSDGAQTYVNPALCNMLGWTEEELTGNTAPHKYWPEEEMSNITNAFAKTLSGDIPKEGFELKFCRKNGERFDVLVMVTPINDASDKGSKWLASVTDISEMKKVQNEIKEINDKLEERVAKRTVELKSLVEDMSFEISERKRTEEKLKVAYEKLREMQNELIHAEKLASLGRFSAGIAHEIRNPLANISALAQILAEKLSDTKSKRLLDYILENSEIANTIIKDLLNFASPHDIKFENSDIGRILNNVCDLSLSRCEQSKVSLVKHVESNLPMMRLNEEKLMTAFLNFISNALQAMQGGGNLVINASASPSGKEITISFKDTGVGISNENLDKIMEPFFTTKDEGTGLGLSLAYHVIRAHGGKINIESELNSGTIITITFPVIPEISVNE